MEVEIKKNIKELIGVDLLFEDAEGNLFEGKVEEVRENAIKLRKCNETCSSWVKTEGLKVVDILNC
jgi:hypothetical protein